MVDNLTVEQRARNMRGIRSRNTRPEMIVRFAVHRAGFRFRLHYSKLPGKPDLVFPRLRKIILVHGCFWHMHGCKRGMVTPSTNTEYWRRKRERTVERDAVNQEFYSSHGWTVLVVWECEIKQLDVLTDKILDFLHSTGEIHG